MGAQETPIQVLLVADPAKDESPVLDELRRSGYAPEVARVPNVACLREALARSRAFDLIIGDWPSPGLDALAGLGATREIGLRTPFVVVCDTIGEEDLVSAIVAGASDFILRDRMWRLGQAVHRELAIVAARRETEGRLAVAERALARNERLRTLGEMAAGIAHDLNNLMQPISLHSACIRRMLGAIQTEASNGHRNQIEVHLDGLDRSVQRGTETICRLRDFASPSAVQNVEAVDVNRAANEALEIVRQRRTPRGDSPKFELSFGNPPDIEGDHSEFVSLFVNLLANAIDALTGGGVVAVSTSGSDGGCLVGIDDNGCGMSPEVERRLFEPFFTTKASIGTGLGLAMVHASVRRYQGQISFETSPGRGTKFRLWFPGSCR